MINKIKCQLLISRIVNNSLQISLVKNTLSDIIVSWIAMNITDECSIPVAYTTNKKYALMTLISMTRKM